MSKIEEAIKEIDEMIEVFDEPEATALRNLKKVLESEPEPTEFTQKWRNKAENLLVLAHVKQNGNREEDKDIGKTWTILAGVILEACDTMDRLTAENKKLKRPMKSAGFKAEGMMAVGQELINRDRQRDELISENENLFAENKILKEFARSVIKEVCWDLGGTRLRELDGGNVQAFAARLGLIKRHTITEADKDKYPDRDVSDPIFKFSEILERSGK